jgi:hypothetical protein
MSYGANDPNGLPLGLPSILSLGLPPLVNPYPALNLDFINNQTLDSRVTFSRGSQATLFDSTGTLVYAKHNLWWQSQDFATTWSATASSVATNSTTAPDGTLTADTLTIDSTTAQHFISQNVTPQAGFSYILSVFAKKNTASLVQIGGGSGAFGTNAWANFDLDAGVLGTVGSSATASIISVGNGWYRCSITATATTTVSSGSFFAFISSSTSSRLPSFAGNGTDSIFLWGAQFNLANMEGGVTSSLTTYYPTTTAAYYAPRFDYNPSTLQPLGLLIEEARTNSLRNSTMVGAVAGTPGTVPTNWTISGLGTLTQEIVGISTINGINYIDIRFSGTTSTTQLNVRLESSNSIAAANGQTWAFSAWTAVVAGSLTNITGNGSNANLYNSSAVFVGGVNFAIPINTSGSLTRVSAAATIATATTAFIQPQIYFTFASGVAIDFTLRIGLPQLELGAFATSVIPTTTTALTRNADVASMTGTNFSSWYSASEGTLFVDVQASANASTAYLTISNGTQTSNSVYFDNDSGNIRNVVFSGSSAVAVINLGARGTIGDFNKLCAAYKLNDFAAVRNGGSVGTDTSGAVPVGVSQMNIGANTAGTAASYLNGTIRRLAFYPQRLANSQLQALTS